MQCSAGEEGQLFSLACVALVAHVTMGSRPSGEASALVGPGANALAAAVLADGRAAVRWLPLPCCAIARVGADTCATAEARVAVKDIVAGNLRAVVAVPAGLTAAAVGPVAGTATAAVIP